MKDKKMKWKKIIRESGLIEWECEHGIGHPDEVSAQIIADKFGHSVETWMTHGCDSCCSRDDFPGKDKKS